MHVYSRLVLKNVRYMAWSRSAQHRAAVLWKKYRTPVARSVLVRSSLRVTCQAQLPHSHGFTDSVRVTAPPQLIRGPSNRGLSRAPGAPEA